MIFFPFFISILPSFFLFFFLFVLFPSSSWFLLCLPQGNMLLVTVNSYSVLWSCLFLSIFSLLFFFSWLLSAFLLAKFCNILGPIPFSVLVKFLVSVDFIGFLPTCLCFSTLTLYSVYYITWLYFSFPLFLFNNLVNLQFKYLLVTILPFCSFFRMLSSRFKFSVSMTFVSFCSFFHMFSSFLKYVVCFFNLIMLCLLVIRYVILSISFLLLFVSFSA